MITIRLSDVTRDGGARELTTAAGTTVAAFISANTSGSFENSLVRVNRAASTADQILVDGDRVSITPTNIKGA